MKATINITKCKPKTFMNLHTELGSADIDGRKVRFCQSLNGLCFWLSVDDELYQLKTEELMNAVLNVVMSARRSGIPCEVEK
jgi:hypothetical protein